MPEIDVEVVISPQPKDGLSRHLGGLYKANGTRDNEAIANALFDIAKQLGVSHPAEQRQAQMWEGLFIIRNRLHPVGLGFACIVGFYEKTADEALSSTTPTTRYVRAEELDTWINRADELYQTCHMLSDPRSRFIGEVYHGLKSLRGEK